MSVDIKVSLITKAGIVTYTTLYFQDFLFKFLLFFLYKLKLLGPIIILLLHIETMLTCKSEPVIDDTENKPVKADSSKHSPFVF